MVRKTVAAKPEKNEEIEIFHNQMLGVGQRKNGRLFIRK